MVGVQDSLSYSPCSHQFYINFRFHWSFGLPFLSSPFGRLIRIQLFSLTFVYITQFHSCGCYFQYLFKVQQVATSFSLYSLAEKRFSSERSLCTMIDASTTLSGSTRHFYIFLIKSTILASYRGDEKQNIYYCNQLTEQTLFCHLGV